MRARFFYLFFLVAFFSCEKTEHACITDGDSILKHVQIIAHRGVTAYAEENSLKALTKATEIKVDAVEFDVMLSFDGELMVFHDSLLLRMTGKNGRIQDFPRDSLRAFFLKNKMGFMSDECIPSLEDVLDSLGERIYCYIEMKFGGRILEKKLVDMIEKRGLVNKVTIQSFDNEALKRVHALNPDIPLLFLIFDSSRSPCVPGPEAEFEHIQRFGIHHSIMNMEILKNMREYYGKKVFVYTVNSCTDLREAYYPFIDGIITDEPEYWLSLKKL